MLEDRSYMQVKIDGAMYDLGSDLAVENIRSGNHTITIYKTDNTGFRKRTQVIYSSTMYVSPAQLISIDINRSGKVVVKTSSTDRYDRNDRNYNRNSNSRDNRYERQ